MLPDNEDDLSLDILSQITADDETDEIIEDNTPDDDDDDDLVGDTIDDQEDVEDAAELNIDDDDDDDDTAPDTTVVADEQPQPQPDADEFNPDVRLQEDKKGNLLSPSGRLIARAGQERSLFEGWRKRYSHIYNQARQLQQNHRDLASSARDMQAEYQALQQNKNMFEQANMTFDEQRQMLDVGSVFKQNPIEGIKKMLTIAHLQGVDITELGVSGAIDGKFIADSVKQHVTDQLKPFTDKETTLRKSAEETKQATIEVQTFFKQNPDAEATAKAVGHENFATILGSAKQAYPDMSWSEIWLRLKEASAKQPVAVSQKSKPKRTTRPVSRRGKPKPVRTTGAESFKDIGKDVLASFNIAN